MLIAVQLFARARDLAGVPCVSLEVDERSTVGALRVLLTKRYPALAGFLERCTIAVSDEYADDAAVLRHGAQVAVLPPVSGG